MNLKTEPEPGVDSTQMRPPWRSTIFLQIARPMPVPGYSRAAVQALEQHEDALEVLGRDADAVVAHREAPAGVARLGLDVHLRRLGAAELDRVAEQVLEQLGELRRIGHHDAAAARSVIRAPLSSIATRRSAIAVSTIAAQSVGANGRALVPTRE